MAFPQSSRDDVGWSLFTTDPNQSAYTNDTQPRRNNSDTAVQDDQYPLPSGNGFAGHPYNSQNDNGGPSFFSSPSSYRVALRQMDGAGQQGTRSLSYPPSASQSSSSALMPASGVNNSGANTIFHGRQSRINMSYGPPAGNMAQASDFNDSSFNTGFNGQQPRRSMDYHTAAYNVAQRPTPQNVQGPSVRMNLPSAAPSNAKSAMVSPGSSVPSTPVKARSAFAACVGCRKPFRLPADTIDGLCKPCTQSLVQQSSPAVPVAASIHTLPVATTSKTALALTTNAPTAATNATTLTTNAPAPATYGQTLTFFTSTLAAQQSLVRATDPFVPLNLGTDDIHLFNQAFIQRKSKEIYEAYLKPYAPAPAHLSDEQNNTYNSSQKKARAVCEKLLKTFQQKQDASARATLLIGEIQTVHNQGIPLSFDTNGENFKNYALNKTSKATERLQKVIDAVTQNKLVAKDVLEEHNLGVFARSPDQYLRRKSNNFKGNDNKHAMQKKGKELKQAGAQAGEDGSSLLLVSGLLPVGTGVATGGDSFTTVQTAAPGAGGDIGGGLAPNVRQNDPATAVIGAAARPINSLLPKPTPPATIKRSRSDSDDFGSNKGGDGIGAPKRPRMGPGSNGV